MGRVSRKSAPGSIRHRFQHVEEDLLDEVAYLQAHDDTVRELEGWLDMRQSQLNTLIHVIVQGHGTLSKRKRSLAECLTDD